MIGKGAPLSPTVYPLAKGRVWAMLAGSLVFVAVGIVLLVAHSTVKTTVAKALAVAFFGLCSVIFIQRLLRDRPELVLDDAGVDQLVLHDPDAYLARAPKLVRRTASLNARLGFGPVNMATNTLPVPPEAVLDAMRRHCPGLPVQQH
ncbi:hypothetical protein ABZV75_04905 [Streptomyces flaveolus]|uniref:hypothetical protein n=1 Tax=Streptomyces flaveolus TaxID=67297 RepID=UPI0033AB6630